MDFMELAKKRYSVRKYSDKPLDDETLKLITDSALIAPTAKNDQAFKVYVIKSKEALEKINELSPCIFGANVVILVCADKTREYHNRLEEGVTSGTEDASIVATHMMLRAAELGVGSCWVNVFPNSKTAEVFSLPEGIFPVLLMPIGYPAEDSEPSERHSLSRPEAELIETL